MAFLIEYFLIAQWSVHHSLPLDNGKHLIKLLIANDNFIGDNLKEVPLELDHLFLSQFLPQHIINQELHQPCNRLVLIYLVRY